MAGTTPNRGYPYPTPGDPVDIPADIQRFAEAVDTDMQLLDDSTVQRPFARVSWRSTTYQTFVPDQVTECQFDYVDYDPQGLWSATSPNRLVPSSAGLWAAWGLFVDPAAQAGLHDLNLRVNGSDLIRLGNHLNSGVNGQVMTLLGMSYMDGVDDYFTLTFQPLNGLETFRSRGMGLACFRLTNT